MVANSLSGCRVKINRARQHFAELEKEFDAWFLKKPYTVWYYSDLKTRSMVHQLRIQDSVPASWGGIVGDVVHNLRSAFDILAHALVLANGGTPGDHTLFPFSRRHEDLII